MNKKERNILLNYSCYKSQEHCNFLKLFTCVYVFFFFVFFIIYFFVHFTVYANKTNVHFKIYQSCQDNASPNIAETSRLLEHWSLPYAPLSLSLSHKHTHTHAYTLTLSNSLSFFLSANKKTKVKNFTISIMEVRINIEMSKEANVEITPAMFVSKLHCYTLFPL